MRERELRFWGANSAVGQRGGASVGGALTVTMAFLLVSNQEHFETLYPNENYYDMYHYEFMGIVDTKTMQINKGGLWPSLWRMPLWIYLEMYKVTLGDYLARNYTPPELVNPNLYEPVSDEIFERDLDETTVLLAPTFSKIDGFVIEHDETMKKLGAFISDLLGE